MTSTSYMNSKYSNSEDLHCLLMQNVYKHQESWIWDGGQCRSTGRYKQKYVCLHELHKIYHFMSGIFNILNHMNFVIFWDFVICHVFLPSQGEWEMTWDNKNEIVERHKTVHELYTDLLPFHLISWNIICRMLLIPLILG